MSNKIIFALLLVACFCDFSCVKAQTLKPVNKTVAETELPKVVTRNIKKSAKNQREIFYVTEGKKVSIK